MTELEKINPDIYNINEAFMITEGHFNVIITTEYPIEQLNVTLAINIQRNIVFYIRQSTTIL